MGGDNMRTEEEIRLDGFEWDNVYAAFCWSDLSLDFIRELAESDPVFKTQLEHQLLLDLQGWSEHAAIYYQNMYNYIKIGVAELKQLELHMSRLWYKWRQKSDQEFNARRNVYRITDGTGRVLDQWIM